MTAELRPSAALALSSARSRQVGPNGMTAVASTPVRGAAI